jgi:hypothetical protein
MSLPPVWTQQDQAAKGEGARITQSVITQLAASNVPYDCRMRNWDLD